MATVAEIAAFLDEFAPSSLAEEWDNVGLLMGDHQEQVSKVMTCLTLTPTSAAEAIREGADLVVTHHPLPFRPVKRITTATTEGRMLWQLARAGIAIYSPHTAFDSAASGINRLLADGLGLTDVQPLTPSEDDPAIGTGRVGTAKPGANVSTLAEDAKRLLDLGSVRVVGKAAERVTKVAIACGSGGSMVSDAVAAGCDAFVTGEATFHTCLAAEAQHVALILVGHYASERFAVEVLTEELGGTLTGVTVWASSDESDPIAVI